MMETVSYIESFSEPGRVEAWCESDIAEDHSGVASLRGCLASDTGRG